VRRAGFSEIFPEGIGFKDTAQSKNAAQKKLVC
jgi:hypothetical protein